MEGEKIECLDYSIEDLVNTLILFVTLMDVNKLMEHMVIEKVQPKKCKKSVANKICILSKYGMINTIKPTSQILVQNFTLIECSS